ncbi:porin family protein [Chryseobacterium sp. PMSZPI]|uniref:porin family protein n=1 Tax=Chryseobacterium sp. PMSZPI TaxID=1033900 RepID=UPI001613394D|nr:porin family protein [Chryseobacterium sp. PMSZPI]
MSNQWLNNLRSRMEDHEEEVPDELWDDIREDLFSEENKHTIIGFVPQEQSVIEEKNIEKTSYRHLFYRVGGVAVAAVLAFFAIKMIPYPEERNSGLKNTKETKKTKDTSLVLKNIDTRTSLPLENKVDAGNLVPEKWIVENLKEKDFKKKVHPEIYNNDENIAEFILKGKELNGLLIPKLPAQEVVIMNEILPQQIEEKETVEVVFPLEKKQEKYADNKKAHSKKPWMLSMLTGNASSNTAQQQFPGYASISGKPMSINEVWSTSTYDENPLTAVLLANQSKLVEARIKHRVPVTLGLSLYYNLGKKWGLGTGLNYTKLMSELHSGSGANYIKGEQTLHYVGIPVQVNYNVVEKGRFTGYITGGALVEKPVSGSLTTTYIVNDEVKETSKERLDNKPLQFSVNTGVGLQLKVIDKFGIYAEPGIGYHFKDDNSPNTIYKEKPLQFNLKFGIRLLLD